MRGANQCVWRLLLLAALTTAEGRAGSLARGSSRPSERRVVASASPAFQQRGAGKFQLQSIPNNLRHVMASAMSGAVSVTILAPIEVLRLNFVVNPELTFRAALTSLSLNPFRGNTADVVAGSARIGIIMPAFAIYKKAAHDLLCRLDPKRDPDQRLPGWATFGSGALAGCTSTCILFPLEVARTRMAMECSIDSVYSCLSSVLDAEGLRAVYRGLTTSLCGVMPFNALKLGIYDIVRRSVIAARHAAGESSVDGTSLPPALTASIGAFSGVFAATSCFPIEVIRRKQMVGELAGLSLPDALVTLAQTEGASALFRGVGLNVVKVALSNSLGFVLYEVMKDCLRVDGRPPPWEPRPALTASAKGARRGRPPSAKPPKRVRAPAAGAKSRAPPKSRALVRA